METTTWEARYSADIDAITAAAVLSLDDNRPAYRLDVSMIEFAQSAAEWAPIDGDTLRILGMDPREYLDAIEEGHEDDGAAGQAVDCLREDADFCESWLVDSGAFQVSNDGGLTIYDASKLSPRQRRIVAEGEGYDPAVDAPDSDADYADDSGEGETRESTLVLRLEGSVLDIDRDRALIEFAQEEAGRDIHGNGGDAQLILHLRPGNLHESATLHHERVAGYAAEALRNYADFCATWLTRDGSFTVGRHGALTIRRWPAAVPTAPTAPAQPNGDLVAVMRINNASDGIDELRAILRRGDGTGAVDFPALMTDGTIRTVRIIVGTEQGGA